MGNVLQATPHLPINQFLSKPPGPSAKDGWDEPGWLIATEGPDTAILYLDTR